MAGIADVVGIAAAVAKAVPGTAGAAAAAAQAAAEAAADHCDDVLESIPEDYSTLSSDVSDLKSHFVEHDTTTVTFATLTYGELQANGNVYNTQLYSYTQEIQVNEGDVVRAKRHDTNADVNMRHVCAYNDGTVVAASGTDTNSATYTVPSGITHIKATISTSTSGIEYDIYVFRADGGVYLADDAVNPAIEDRIENVEFVFDRKSGVVETITPVYGGSGEYQANGIVYVTTSYKYTQRITVNPGDVITVKNNGNAVNMRHVCAYDRWGQVIESKGTNTNSSSFTIPDGIKQVVLSVPSSNSDPNVILRSNASGVYVLKDSANSLAAGYTLPSIIVPAQSFAVVGHEWNMYYDNITDGVNYDTMYVFCSGISGKSYERFLRWTPTANDVGTHELTITIYNKKTGDIIDQKTLNLIVSANSTSAKKFIAIGDSQTQEGTYIHEIQYELSGGNYVSVGTRTTTDTAQAHTIYHEGRASWSAYNYTEQASMNDVVNAFWNPTASKFDFSYYMTQNGFSGIDCVMLNLGINGMGNIERTCGAIDTMIASIHDYDSSIKIIVSLITPPCMQDGCGHHVGMWSADYYKRLELETVSNYIKKYDGVNDNVYVSEPYFNIDRLYDFPTATIAASSRNPTQITIQNNNMHPNVYGYKKIADVYYQNLVYRLA